MQGFPLFGQDNVSQQGQPRHGHWRASKRGRDFDTQSVQTNDAAWSRYGNDKSPGLSTAYYDCIRNLQVHVETMLNRFHDLYERRGRLAEAARLSETSIVCLLREYDDDRVVAALHLLAETYQRCDLPQANEARKTLMDWWEYLRHHRHPNRNPNKGEVDYEQEKAYHAKEAAMAFWKHYNMLLENPGRWLDTYLAEATARERDVHMQLRIQALNAADKEFALKTNLHSDNFWFDNKPLIPTRRRLNPLSDSRSVKRDEKLDFDKLGHFEARKAEKDRIMKIFNQYRQETVVMGETSNDHQTTTAMIDTGDEGPNIISLAFLKKLKLESIVETDWSGDSEKITDASGNELKPIGWVELYFKFKKLPGGWHSSLFWVTDVTNYTMIIGMPCLLQENIKSKVIAPLIPNQKKKEKENSQTPDSRENQERQQRAERRRNEMRRDDMKKWKDGPSPAANSNAGSTSTIALLVPGSRFRDSTGSASQPTSDGLDDDDWPPIAEPSNGAHNHNTTMPAEPKGPDIATLGSKIPQIIDWPPVAGRSNGSRNHSATMSATPELSKSGSKTSQINWADDEDESAEILEPMELEGSGPSNVSTIIAPIARPGARTTSIVSAQVAAPVPVAKQEGSGSASTASISSWTRPSLPVCSPGTEPWTTISRGKKGKKAGPGVAGSKTWINGWGSEGGGPGEGGKGG